MWTLFRSSFTLAISGATYGSCQASLLAKPFNTLPFPFVVVVSTRIFVAHAYLPRSTGQMADPIGLLKSVVQLLQAVRDAVEGAEAVQTTMRDRLGDYASVLDTLQENPERVAVFNIEHELGRLQTLFGDTQDKMKNAVSPGDCLCVRLCKMVNLSFKHKSLTEELDTIDKDVDRIFGAINVKMGCRAAVLPSLPDMARVPEGAGKSRVADIYVERNSYLEEVVQGITQDVGGISSAPWVVVGMGGAGKSVLAASVVRNTDTRQHYRQGIFWVSVGQHKKEQLVALFLPLVWAMRQAATDHQYAVPSSFENPESLAAHLRAVTEATPRPRLVVLDNVWEREVVDFLMETGLNLLVTTRDASIVNRQSGQTNVGNMSDDQAVRLLLKASSKTASMPAAEVKAAILKASGHGHIRNHGALSRLFILQLSPAIYPADFSAWRSPVQSSSLHSKIPYGVSAIEFHVSLMLFLQLQTSSFEAKMSTDIVFSLSTRSTR